MRRKGAQYSVSRGYLPPQRLFQTQLSCSRHTFPEPMHVVRQVPESDFNFRPGCTNSSKNEIAGDLYLNAKDMLDTAPYL